jgi:hypothetical protein
MAAPVELRSTSSRGLARWMKDLFGRGAPRARVVAPREVHLGQQLVIEWGVDCPQGNLATVRVTLAGSEIARHWISARTGISIESQTCVFQIIEIARAVPEPGVRVAYGCDSLLLPGRTVPSLSGRYNEIAWAIVVEADFQPTASSPDAPPLREWFPIVVLISLAWALELVAQPGEEKVAVAITIAPGRQPLVLAPPPAD